MAMVPSAEGIDTPYITNETSREGTKMIQNISFCTSSYYDVEDPPIQRTPCKSSIIYSGL